MKTTIDLPDDVLYRAKVVAAERRTTLKELVLQGLEHVMRAGESDSETERQGAIRDLLLQMRASNTEAMVPLTRESIHER